jgi:neutral ceramidase
VATLGQLRAGVARAFVTPQLGIYLIGYADRGSGCRSIHDDLTATALILDDGATQLVIIALDMLALNERIVERVRTGIVERWHIPPEQVMVCCSHTHSGPIAYADEKSKRKERQFIDGLVDKLVAVVGEALVEQVAVSAAWARGEAHIAINRRELSPDGTMVIGVNLDGPVDRSLNVLQLCHQGSGQPLVTLVNLACHATVLGPSSYAVSAEWPGVMRRQVEETLGGLCMFLQGATGNLNPNHEWGDDDLQVMEQLGRNVAEQVLGNLTALKPFTATPLRARSESTWLPITPQMRPDGSGPLTYKEVLAKYAGIPKFMVDRVLKARYPWKTSLEQRDGQWHVPMEIQAFRLGDCVVVAHAAEVFNEIGGAIKNESPAPITLFAGYSNGCVGYLPTATEHARGGYEVELSPYIYRMPGLLDPGCEALVTEQTLEMLHALILNEESHVPSPGQSRDTRR